jgi:4-carboxymuconolactone decarboxylase
MPSERAERGMDILRQINPQSAEALFAELEPIAPDLSRFVAEFAYGDIYARPGLSLREREMITVAALTAQGNAAPQLKSHIVGALNSGCTQQEIIEIMIQMAVYAGFPSAINGIMAAKDVFAARKGKEADPA